MYKNNPNGCVKNVCSLYQLTNFNKASGVTTA